MMIKKEDITQEVLEKVKKTQLEILIILRDFCEKNSINYSLTAGTMLGAVRHGGFIPWDDDIDVMMDRNNYNRFISLWNKSHPKGFLIQNKQTSPEFSQTHCKLKKDHTTFLQDGEDKFEYHKGIFIDIFPMDRGPVEGIKGKLFRIKGMFFLLYTRGFVPETAGTVTRFISKFFLMVVPKSKYFSLSEKIKRKLIKNDDNEQLNTLSLACMEDFVRAYPKDMLKNFEKISFEGEEFSVTKRKNDFLKIRYGDYMSLPPEEERVWIHKPVLIDFEKNFKELNFNE